MVRFELALTTLATACVLVACATSVPAPGATNVKVTRNPADVASCAPVGNISNEIMRNGDPLMARNKAVGLNGNVILDTGTGGIAYHCATSAGN